MKKLQHLLAGQHRVLTQDELRNSVGGQGLSLECLNEGDDCKLNPAPTDLLCCEDQNLICAFDTAAGKSICIKQ